MRLYPINLVELLAMTPTIAIVPIANHSGFEWLLMNRFELHLYNIRHIQHRIGQLVERLRAVGISGVDWKG